MSQNYKKMKNLFLRQSYLDAWEDYENCLKKSNFIWWDMVILTASNEAQAEAYTQQINYRLNNGLLPAKTHFAVLPDPDGKRVGSGGATFNVLKYIADSGINNTNVSDIFKNKRILVIHSGGDSKRIPQYSACGKLFSSVPRELPNGNASTLFDEFMVSTSGIPSRIPEGMLVLSGDVLLLFNPLQIDCQFNGAAAISIKEHVSIGKNHGVFLNDGNDNVGSFLHKQTEEMLRAKGAVNERDCVDLDTGAVLLDTDLLMALFSLIGDEHGVNNNKFDEFVNEKARISFYGDFLFPLAKESTLEKYLKETPEGNFCDELKNCREKICNVLNKYSMKLLCLSPAEFIHFGTTKELMRLVTCDVDDYEFLDWKRAVLTNVDVSEYAVHNSFIDKSAQIGRDCFIENSYISKNVTVGQNTVISNIELENVEIPSNVVLHGVKLDSGKYVVRIYGVGDNPKSGAEGSAEFLGISINDIIISNGLSKTDIWDDCEQSLWYADIYPVCDTVKSAVNASLILYNIACKKASQKEIDEWRRYERLSLYSSFNSADVKAVIPWKKKLTDIILADKFMNMIDERVHYKETFNVFGNCPMSEFQYNLLMDKADNSDFFCSIRIYYYLSKYMKYNKMTFAGKTYENIERLCFDTIQKVISQHNLIKLTDSSESRIEKPEVNIKLPVRVNWGGGWTDTPPYCNEFGGVVLNAAIALKGEYPIQVTVKKLNELHIEFASKDIGAYGRANSIEEVMDCNNPFDPFALHKAALISCGIIPLEHNNINLEQILGKLGGGIYISTEVINVPKGSGLGTSSILAGACVKGLSEFLGKTLTDAQVYDTVLCMEQIMSTGGGWQDQVGGLSSGIKFITTEPGLKQEICVDKVEIPENAKRELNERFVLIYTGQRRLARNLLRDVVGNYIGSRSESLDALYRMKRVAALMKFELERGNIDEFAELLNKHWELSKQLDEGSTNTCIDQIFMVCENLIAGKFIAGAGGGGFLQVILKKGVTKEELHKRLNIVFQDSGVDVWDCELV